MLRVATVVSLFLLMACGGKQASAPSATPSAAAAAGGADAPEVPGERAEIEALMSKISGARQKVGLDAEPAQALVERPLVESATESNQCKEHAEPKTARCQDVCKYSQAICESANRVCELAEKMADEWSRAKCDSAKASCREASERCCGCIAGESEDA